MLTVENEVMKKGCCCAVDLWKSIVVAIVVGMWTYCYYLEEANFVGMRVADWLSLLSRWHLKVDKVSTLPKLTRGQHCQTYYNFIAGSWRLVNFRQHDCCSGKLIVSVFELCWFIWNSVCSFGCSWFTTGCSWFTTGMLCLLAKVRQEWVLVVEW